MSADSTYDGSYARRMGGYTKEQLETRGSRLENYNYCENCGLFWARSVYKKHLNVRAPAPELSIVSPADERFLKWLVESAMEQFIEEHTETLPDGTKVRPHVVLGPEWEAVAKEPKTVFTVDEAVELGYSREEILAQVERRREPFVVEIPAAGAGHGVRGARRLVR